MSPHLRMTCNCGSGEYPTWQYDGYGIALCKTCSQCHARKMKSYRADIKERYDTDEPIEPDEPSGCLDDEESLDYFNRYIAGDR